MTAQMPQMPEGMMDEASKAALQKQMNKKVFVTDKQVMEWVLGSETGDDLYKRLDVEKTSDKKEIEKQFRKMGPLVHAKKSEEKDAPKAFKKVLQAFLILADDDIRKVYDEVGLGGVDQAKLSDAKVPDVTDVLQEGQNKSTEFMTDTLKRVSMCGEEMYTVLGLDESKGSTHTQDQIEQAFKETQDGLELDLDNIMVYSNALNKLIQAYTILSDPKQRAKYDTGELKVDTTLDPDDPMGQKSLQRLMDSKMQKPEEGVRKRKKKKKFDDEWTEEDIPPEFMGLYRSMTGQLPVEEPKDHSSAPETPWYKDFRLFLILILVGLYVAICWKANRMPGPKPPPTMEEAMTRR